VKPLDGLTSNGFTYAQKPLPSGFWAYFFAQIREKIT